MAATCETSGTATYWRERCALASRVSRQLVQVSQDPATEHRNPIQRRLVCSDEAGMRRSAAAVSCIRCNTTATMQEQSTTATPRAACCSSIRRQPITAPRHPVSRQVRPYDLPRASCSRTSSLLWLDLRSSGVHDHLEDLEVLRRVFGGGLHGLALCDQRIQLLVLQRVSAIISHIIIMVNHDIDGETEQLTGPRRSS